MVIRWLGYASLFRGEKSLRFEFNNPGEMEVSAEWTIKNRPFIIPTKPNVNVQYGLLVKSKAVNKRFKRDGGTGPVVEGKKLIPPSLRNKSLIKLDLLNKFPWECLCKNNYAAFIIVSKLKLNIDNYYCPTERSLIEFVIKELRIPVLIYQALKNSDNEWENSLVAMSNKNFFYETE
jgi:hypothetical protein